jgi:diguanylate cyclase (GGDEF)-like protein
MKIGRSKSAGTSGLAGTRAVSRPAKRSAPDGVSGAGTVQDAMSIMGIPEGELTPKVRTAIMGLLLDVDRLRQELEVHRERVRHLEKLADQDALVPMANRRAFVRELARMIAFTERYDTPASLLYFDINRLKEINDTLGHAAGDAVIRHVANTLNSNVRGSDIVGRLGGDEFAVLLSHADQPTAEDKAAVLAATIESEPFAWEGDPIPLKIAYGSYTFKGGEDPAIALDAADRAMYARKQESRLHGCHWAPPRHRGSPRALRR